MGNIKPKGNGVNNKVNHSFKSQSDRDKEASEKYPEHIMALYFILRNNAEIRRFCSIGIINYLLQKNEIKGKKRYVQFLYTKFVVRVDGINKEYSYTEPFFINCLVASFASFANNAQISINEFVELEVDKADENDINNDNINSIISMNRNSVHNK